MPEKDYIKKITRGATIFEQGQSGQTMFIIHSGRVRLTRDIGGQREDLGLLEKGDFFGEMSVLEDIKRTASAIAEEDCELIEIDKEGFTKLLKSNVEIPIRMIRKYALKLEDMNRKFEYVLQNKREYDKGIREIISQLKGNKEEAKSDQSSIGYLLSQDEKYKFSISNDSTLIGRVDPVTNIVPDIDLTSIDIGRTVSRRHARLTYVNDKLYLVEEIGVTNGTFLNGTRLNPGELKEIKDGDKVGLGKTELTFKAN